VLHGMQEWSPKVCTLLKQLRLIPKSQFVHFSFRFDFSGHNHSPLQGWLAGSMACDSIITMALVWQVSLNTHIVAQRCCTFFQLSRRRNEGFSNVKNDVHRAIRLTVETGALTTIVTAIDLALYLTSSLTNWYLLLGMMIGKL
jgi:Family of unknown function (DUF6534)